MEIKTLFKQWQAADEAKLSECAPEPATPANSRLPKIWPAGVAGVAGGYMGDIAGASRPA